MDENPVGVRVTVNGRYPDTVPVSTVPPQVLQTLPKLSEDMEYRFIGDRLILLDAHAHVIADFIDDALPRLIAPGRTALGGQSWFCSSQCSSPLRRPIQGGLCRKRARLPLQSRSTAAGAVERPPEQGRTR